MEVQVPHETSNDAYNFTVAKRWNAEAHGQCSALKKLFPYLEAQKLLKRWMYPNGIVALFHVNADPLVGRSRQQGNRESISNLTLGTDRN